MSEAKAVIDEAMYSSRVDRAKRIPAKCQIIVHGFVRDINNSSPDLVIMHILCYYYMFPYFTSYGNTITISGHEQNIATSTDIGVSSAYFGDWIESMDTKIIKCRMKLTSIDEQCEPKFLIGIVSDDSCIDEVFFNAEPTPFVYCIADNGAKRHWNPDEPHKVESYTNQQFKSGVIITFILDLSTGILSFEKDGSSLGECYNAIAMDNEIKYKIVIAMRQKGDTITIAEYEEYE